MRDVPVARDSRGRLLPGASLNPDGKPKGAVGQVGRFRDAIAGQVPEILAVVLEQAVAGDLTAARIILDRVLPPLRPEARAAALPQVRAADNLVDKSVAILDAMAAQEIAPETGVQLLAALTNVARIWEMNELAARIEALEQEKSALG